MKHFTTREVAKILDVPEERVRTYARAGLIAPQRGTGRRMEFSFQELLLLKTTKGLMDAGVPTRRLRRIWSSLRRQLDNDLPLTRLSIFADGDRVVAWDGNAAWQPDSGQFVLNFDAGEVVDRVESATGEVLELSSRMGSIGTGSMRGSLRLVEGRGAAEGGSTATIEEAPALTAEQWFHLAGELESSSPAESRQAYHHALELDPSFADAHLDLGRHYHESGELGKAEAHYREAVRAAPEDPTAHFNLGVLLEDRGRREEAVHAYRQAIARDPELADAHYNLGLLLETLARRSEAMAHLMTARRLYGTEEDSRGTEEES